MTKTFTGLPIFFLPIKFHSIFWSSIVLMILCSACATTQNSLMGGTWEIQEEERSYIATLDANGNGSYTWKNGSIQTIECVDGKWKGTWQQTGNDREGGFEIVLSEDGQEAKGVWWYTRVGENDNIPPYQFGGKYKWVRAAAESK